LSKLVKVIVKKKFAHFCKFLKRVETNLENMMALDFFGTIF